MTYRSHDRPHGEQCHGFSSLLLRSDVRDSAAANTHRPRGSTTANESKDKEHRNIRAKGTSRSKCEVDGVAEVINNEAAMQLGKRCKEERTEGETKHVEADCHSLDRGIGDVEFLRQFFCSWSEHGCSQVTRKRKSATPCQCLTVGKGKR